MCSVLEMLVELMAKDLKRQRIPETFYTGK